MKSCSPLYTQNIVPYLALSKHIKTLAAVEAHHDLVYYCSIIDRRVVDVFS